MNKIPPSRSSSGDQAPSSEGRAPSTRNKGAAKDARDPAQSLERQKQLHGGTALAAHGGDNLDDDNLTKLKRNARSTATQAKAKAQAKAPAQSRPTLQVEWARPGLNKFSGASPFSSRPVLPEPPQRQTQYEVCSTLRDIMELTQKLGFTIQKFMDAINQTQLQTSTYSAQQDTINAESAARKAHKERAKAKHRAKRKFGPFKFVLNKNFQTGMIVGLSILSAIVIIGSAGSGTLLAAAVDELAIDGMADLAIEESGEELANVGSDEAVDSSVDSSETGSSSDSGGSQGSDNGLSNPDNGTSSVSDDSTTNESASQNLIRALLEEPDDLGNPDNELNVSNDGTSNAPDNETSNAPDNETTNTPDGDGDGDGDGQVSEEADETSKWQQIKDTLNQFKPLLKSVLWTNLASFGVGLVFGGAPESYQLSVQIHHLEKAARSDKKQADYTADATLAENFMQADLNIMQISLNSFAGTLQSTDSMLGNVNSTMQKVEQIIRSTA